jgi:membrane-bound serine protease (ClpP class)
VIGAAATVVGTFGLYHHLSLRWPAVVLGIAGVAVFMLGAMPAMLRSRFGTPTIGRDSMIGSRGTALGALNPEGTVRVGGAEWRARTNRATPIEKGAPVRVVAIDGVLLEVEPEDESRRARDYRAPRSSH